ncbi:hypothetical protein [Clostridium transplantifaecale]|uniref:hypothetical protein n=1 Tax=Clostridium transplantifaecale TaxID=2479838 RepID=UPI000F62EC60|nr:hypothetical protein [Clostridium transplantifaecale]
MTWFTCNPLEKMMTQKPGGRRENAPPIPRSPECASCPYRKPSPCVGFCIRRLAAGHKKEKE